MVNLKNRKGAVELSLNLIIMLIIGMVVLGLVIGFVNSLVNKGTENFNKQLGDNEKLKLQDVASCSENLCVSPEPSVEVEKGASPNLYIKVRGFSGPVACGPGDLNDDGCEVTYEVTNDEDSAGDYLSVSGPGFEAEEGGEDAKRYFLNIDKATPVGIYYLTLKLSFGDDDSTVSKTITVDVK